LNEKVLPIACSQVEMTASVKIKNDMISRLFIVVAGAWHVL